MKLTGLIIAIVCSLLSKGITEEYSSTECQLNLKFEDLAITAEGIILQTDTFGTIKLDNLQFDEEGYYSLWQIAFICTDCKKKVESFESVCENCGSEEVAVIRIDKHDGSEYLVRLLSKIEKIVQKFEERESDLPINRTSGFGESMAAHDHFTPEYYGYFDRASQLGATPMGAIVQVQGNIDNAGNKSGSLKVSDTFKDKKGNDRCDYEVEGEVSQDKNGKKTAKVGGKLSMRI